MKFSIITCTWNSIATLAETIQSVQAQTHPDIEHLFVDGGSTDGTLELIARECPGAKVLLGVSGGISRAMNAGIHAATGDVIAHLHSDDFYADGQVLARVAAALTESGRMWAFGGLDTLRDGVRRPAPQRAQAFSPAGYASGGVAILHPTVFVRREVFDAVGMFDESLRYTMDIDLWLRIGPRFVPVEINATLAVFRAHAGSVSTANAPAARREEWQVRRRYLARWPLATLICALRHRRMAARERRALAPTTSSSGA